MKGVETRKNVKRMTGKQSEEPGIGEREARGSQRETGKRGVIKLRAVVEWRPQRLDREDEG